MNSIGSQHATGRAAYDQRRPSTAPRDASDGSESTTEADATAETTATAALDRAGGDELTVEEQAMIEENFPEDPELSMRLYGRSRNTHTVDPAAVGGNLDVTG